MSRLFSIKAIIATIITLILLAASGFGYIYYLNQKVDTLISLNPVTKEPVSLTLTLSSPDNNLLVFDGDLLVSGKTTPGATVFLSSANRDLALELSPKGDFSQTLKLVEGVNILIISSFDTLGNKKEEVRTVYYSKEKI